MSSVGQMVPQSLIASYGPASITLWLHARAYVQFGADVHATEAVSVPQPVSRLSANSDCDKGN